MAIKTVKLKVSGRPVPTAQPVRQRMPARPSPTGNPAHGNEVSGTVELRGFTAGRGAYRLPPKPRPHIEVGGVNG